MNRFKLVLATATGAFALAGTSEAQLVLQPLTSFSGDGWLSPAEDANLTENNLQRGLTYDPVADLLYVVDRDGGTSVERYNATTGAALGSLDVTGITGGTFPLNHVDVADDGAIYAANLAIGANLKVYRWANAAAVPTVAFDGNLSATLNRLGDAFAVTGSGTDTRLLVSGSGSDGVAVLDTADGTNFTANPVSPLGTVPAGGVRLGLDWTGSDDIIGMQTGSTIYDANLTANTSNSNPVNSAGEAPLAYDQVDDLLATVDINSSDVRLYDGSDLTALTTTGFQDILNNLGGTASVVNGNGAGDLKFGRTVTGELRLYALNTNNGIQAFQVVPEPATAALLGLGGLALLRRRSA